MMNKKDSINVDISDLTDADGFGFEVVKRETTNDSLVDEDGIIQENKIVEKP